MAWEHFKSFDVRVWKWPPRERLVLHRITAAFFALLGLWALLVDRDVRFASYCFTMLLVALGAAAFARDSGS